MATLKQSMGKKGMRLAQVTGDFKQSLLDSTLTCYFDKCPVINRTKASYGQLGSYNPAMLCCDDPI